MRDTSERADRMKASTLKMVGADENVIYNTTTLRGLGWIREDEPCCNPNGDGYA